MKQALILALVTMATLAAAGNYSLDFTNASSFNNTRPVLSNGEFINSSNATINFTAVCVAPPAINVTNTTLVVNYTTYINSTPNITYVFPNLGIQIDKELDSGEVFTLNNASIGLSIRTACKAVVETKINRTLRGGEIGTFSGTGDASFECTAVNIETARKDPEPRTFCKDYLYMFDECSQQPNTTINGTCPTPEPLTCPQVQQQSGGWNWISFAIGAIIFAILGFAAGGAGVYGYFKFGQKGDKDAIG